MWTLYTLMSCNTIRPPLLFWYFINFSACSRSSSDECLKNLWNPGKATSSRSKYRAYMIDTETIDTRRQHVTTMSVTCSLLTKTPLLYQNSHHLSNSTLTEKLYLSVIDILIIKFYTATEKKKPRCPPWRLNSPWIGMCTRRTAPCLSAGWSLLHFPHGSSGEADSETFFRMLLSL